MKKNLQILILLAFIGLCAHAQVPHLMGLTPAGGTNNKGVIFKINGDSSGFQSVYNFQISTGCDSYNSFCKADNGLYYGIANGGQYIDGVIFSFDPSTNTYTDIVDFNVGNGAGFNNNFIKGPNGKLYGTVSFGGDSLNGAIYSFDPTNNFYTVLHDFGTANISLNQLDCTLLLLTDGFLYGEGSFGGDNNKGGIFRVDTLGNNYTQLFSCVDSTGINPHGNLVQYTNGLLYGVTNQGGTNNDGVIFSYDIGTNTYTVVFNFNHLINGGMPQSGLMMASNGLLYGMTAGGGTSGAGTIFSFDPAANLLTILHSCSLANGSQPFGGLIQASDGKLYGMTENGGINLASLGVVFSYDITTSTYTVIHHFHGPDGKAPRGNLIELIDSTTTGVADAIKGNSVSVYPNPNNGTFTLHSQLSILNSQFLLKDVYGRTVYSQAFTTTKENETITLPLSSGIYFWQLLTNEAVAAKGKLVVIK